MGGGGESKKERQSFINGSQNLEGESRILFNELEELRNLWNIKTVMKQGTDKASFPNLALWSRI